MKVQHFNGTIIQSLIPQSPQSHIPINLLFVQGGSAGAYAADAELATSLQRALGAGYAVRYPAMPNEDDPDYQAWKAEILNQLKTMGPDAILVGHSIGASVIIKLLTEEVPAVNGVFLIATPFWHDDDFWQWKEAQLPADAAARVPKTVPLFFYHGRADESVPIAHLEMYVRLFPGATVRRLDGMDHQLKGDLSVVAEDIKG